MFIDFQGAIVILCFQPSNPEVWAVRSSLATWFVISFVDFSFGKQRAAHGPLGAVGGALRFRMLPTPRPPELEIF